MFAAIKKFAFAIALTLCATTGMTIASGVAAPAPAEAGIFSSVKKATVGAAKAVGRTAVGAAKGVASGAKVVTRTVERKVLLPAVHGIGKAGAIVIKVARKLPGPAKCIIKCPL